MDPQDVILSLVKDNFEKYGNCHETRILKLASLLNINPERYQKIKEKLLQKGKLEIKGNDIILI